MMIIIRSPHILSNHPWRLLPEIRVRATIPPQPPNSLHITKAVISHPTILELIPLTWATLCRFINHFPLHGSSCRTTLILILPPEEPANDGEEDEDDVEGVPAALHQVRIEDLAAKRQDRRDHNE